MANGSFKLIAAYHGNPLIDANDTEVDLNKNYI